MASQRIRLTAATAAVTNRFVTSTNMANGAYTLANTTTGTEGARQVVATITGVGGNDTPGTIAIVGTDSNGGAINETLTLVAGGTATSTRAFKTVTSITQAGWVIVSTNDTIVIGTSAAVFATDRSGTLDRVFVGTTAAGTITLADAAGTIAVLKASIPEGSYMFGLDFGGFLTVAMTAASDVTVTFDTRSY